MWILDGNEGEVHSYVADAGLYFVLLSSRTPGWKPGDPASKTVATIDWAAGALLLNPEIQFNASNPYRMIRCVSRVARTNTPRCTVRVLTPRTRRADPDQHPHLGRRRLPGASARGPRHVELCALWWRIHDWSRHDAYL